MPAPDRIPRPSYGVTSPAGHRIHPGITGLGLVLMGSLIAAISLVQGFLGADASAASLDRVELPFLSGAILLLAGAAYVTARGLGYPVGSASAPGEVGPGGARRLPSRRAKLGERATWAFLEGVGLLVLGVLVGLPAFQFGVCSGPCRSPLPPEVPVALYVLGVVLLVVGGVGLLLRAVGYPPENGPGLGTSPVH